MNLEVVILAAGKGKRMYSKLPKILHPLGGQPLLFHVIKTALSLDAKAVHVVIGHGCDLVKERCQNDLPPKIFAKLNFHLQEKQLGTAHAAGCAMEGIADDSTVLVLYGDTPLITPQLLLPVTKVPEGGLHLLTVKMGDPAGYGRIIRNSQDGRIVRIVEQKDATEDELKITEVNSGILAVEAATLKECLPLIANQNAQGEYYLTDLTGILASRGRTIAGTITDDEVHTAGINNKVQLAALESVYQYDKAQELLMAGITLADPRRFTIRGTLEHGMDDFIDINVVIEGEVKLGDNVSIGPGCVLKDCTIGDDSVISPYTVIEGSVLHKHNTIGPFARLRPGSELDDEVHVGNFVEVKKSHLGYATKAGHLSYLGDSQIGRDVNIGAGTITCNYDGACKHQTIIGDDVFVGSDTQLIAPVEVEAHATIGAGTTVTRKVPQGALIITRARPSIIENYPRPRKNK